jgi:hypothetical protein
MLPARQDDAPDSNHVLVANRFPDDGERIVPSFPVGDQVVGADEIPRVDAGLRNSSMSIVRVDSPALTWSAREIASHKTLNCANWYRESK